MTHLPENTFQLAGTRLTLRPPKRSHQADRLVCGRDSEFARMVGDEPATGPLTQAEVEDWYQWLSARPVGWVIDVEDRAVGDARLDHFNFQDRCARYAVGIFDPSLRGQGIGTEATRLVRRAQTNSWSTRRCGYAMVTGAMPPSNPAPPAW